MSQELRATVLMLDAIRHELRAASFVANRGAHHEIQDEGRRADDLAHEARKAVERVEQEAETSG